MAASEFGWRFYLEKSASNERLSLELPRMLRLPSGTKASSLETFAGGGFGLWGEQPVTYLSIPVFQGN